MSLIPQSQTEQLIRTTGGIQVAMGATSTWGHYETVVREEFEDEVRGAGVTMEVPSVVIASAALAARQGDLLKLTADADLELGWTEKDVIVLWRQAEEDGAVTRLGLGAV